MGLLDLLGGTLKSKIAKGDIDGLITALQHRKPTVRMQAAEALGQIGDGRAVETLIAALKDEDRYVRVYAASALGNIGDPRATDALVAALKSKDGALRVNAAGALSQIQDPRAAEPLIRALDDGERAVVDNAARTLGKLREVNAIPRLVALIGDNRSGVVLAADALKKIGDNSAVEPLIDLLKHGDWPRTKAEAAGVLGALGDVRAVGQLVEEVPCRTATPIRDST